MNLVPASSGTISIRFGIVIVCEDTNGNFYYLQDKIKDCFPNAAGVLAYPNPIGIHVHTQNSEDVGHADALNITEYAIQEAALKNAAYKNNEIDEESFFYREVYCVIDVDNNIVDGKLAQAYAAIAAATTTTPQITYKLIVSNECFEIWYILHFQNITQSLYRGTPTQVANGLTNHANKINTILQSCIDWESIPLDENKPNTSLKSYKSFFAKMNTDGNEAEAIQRAKALETASTRSQPFDNPSTDLYILIERLNSFKR